MITPLIKNGESSNSLFYTLERTMQIALNDLDTTGTWESHVFCNIARIVNCNIVDSIFLLVLCDWSTCHCFLWRSLAAPWGGIRSRCIVVNVM